jgi:hypothetical protein
MTTRLRFVGMTLVPQFMADDGDELVPLEVTPIAIRAADWPNVIELFAGAVAKLREQVETPPGDGNSLD